MDTGMLVAGGIAVCLTIFFLIVVVRIEANTKAIAQRLAGISEELQSVNSRTFQMQRDGLKVIPPPQLERVDDGRGAA